MTTDEHNTLTDFFYTVVPVLAAIKDMVFHYPNRPCFNGKCQQPGTALTYPIPGRCNWKAILDLTARFWKSAPEVSEDWKKCARDADFDPDAFHEILVGLFIAGTKERPYYGPSLMDGSFAPHETS